MTWVKLNKFHSKERFALPVQRIHSLHDLEGENAGCCVVSIEPDGQLLNTHVAQDFDLLVGHLNLLVGQLNSTLNT